LKKPKFINQSAVYLEVPINNNQTMLKRLIDISAALLLLLLLTPVIAIIAGLIRSQLGSPILFRQTRSGKNGQPFAIIKFRTMRDATDASGQPLTDAERLTSLGTTLRTLSLDELPELWNVLKGDMSLVGPRPFIADYLNLYTPEQVRRLEVRPGITGWAQINGRNAISWEARFALDVWYVEHQSLWLDLKILLLTVKKVLTRSDIHADNDVTMPRFTGSPQ
jgi:lipopolysaccharide/colanic/teichoic acid biosynthesis glycosyltransferase